jgi:hypothetical protein
MSRKISYEINQDDVGVPRRFFDGSAPGQDDQVSASEPLLSRPARC